jgi:hypothetical protein
MDDDSSDYYEEVVPVVAYLMAAGFSEIIATNIALMVLLRHVASTRDDIGELLAECGLALPPPNGFTPRDLN